ncbi:hypothetical protein NE865_15753 [Phthorimaea operculella]|nr:hypothetical protein NE865_15753 [Phthorimaea operculella]
MTVNLSEEQFKRLLQSIGSEKRGSMATCVATYGGKKDRETVEAFLTAIRVFKEIEKISDKDVLAGLPLVLREEAAVWWQGTKSTVTTWEQFEKSLRNAFAPQKPTYILYSEACTVKQTPDISTDDFITKKRMIFSEFPKDEQFSEKQQLNTIYGLLNLSIRKKVPRENVSDLDDLCVKARAVEVLLKEEIAKQVKGKSNEDQDTQIMTAPSTSGTRAKKPTRCNFCKKIGHTFEECRKRKKVLEDKVKQENDEKATDALSNATTTGFSCYGCGTPGVYRSNCKICTKKPPQSTGPRGSLGFCAIDIHLQRHSRPMVFLKVNGLDGKAYVDTCAKVSVASHELYMMLKKQGQVFYEEIATIVQADGIAKRQRILVFDAVVELCGRSLRTPFIVLLESYETRTLLAIDFQKQAGMILNIAQFTWHYIDDPKQEFELFEEKFVMFNEQNNTPSTSNKVTTEKVGVAPINMERPTKHKRETRETVMKEGTVPTDMAHRPYQLIPLEPTELPPKVNCTESKLLFDGYSPRMEYMMEDAIHNIEEAEPDLSPRAMSLFDDIGICSIDVKSALDTNQELQMKELLQEFEDIFQANGKPEERKTPKGGCPTSEACSSAKTWKAEEAIDGISLGQLEPRRRGV